MTIIMNRATSNPHSDRPHSGPHETPSGGLPLALAAYGIWGLLPLFLQLLKSVPPVELLGWRIIFTLPFCLLIIVVRQQAGELRRALTDRKVVLALLLSALTIGGNWLIFLTAVANHHVLATSLGYYINPLVSVLLGTVFLGERLSRLQWTAVAVAGSGIALLVTGALDTLAISLSLAFSFAFYALVRKKTTVGSVPGLTIETLVLFPFALALTGWFALQPAGTSFGKELDTSLYLVGSGILTAVPLMMFAVAARRLPLSTLGFAQFVAPTLTFIASVTVLGEQLDGLRLICFVLIWVAIGLFSYDMLRQHRAK